MSAWLLDLNSQAVSHQSVVWLELLQCLGRVVDEGESGRLSTTVLCSESEDGDGVLVGFVHLGKLGS